MAEFNPLRNEGSPSPADLQALAELAIAMSIYKRHAVMPGIDGIADIVAFLEEVHENPRIRDRTVRFPNEFIPLCDLTASLLALGHEHGDQLRMLQRILDSGLLDHADYRLHSQMEFRLCLDWARLKHGTPDLDELGRRVPPPPPALASDDGDVYAFTHLIMFSTDFGARPVPSTGELSRTEELSHALSALIVRYTSEQNFDLLAELLLCWDCVRLPLTPLVKSAWQVFCSAQEPDGSFPVRSSESALAPSPNSGSQNGEPSHFRRRYHTTLLATICDSVRRGHGSNGAPEAPALAGYRESNPTLSLVGDIRELPALGHACQWVAGLIDLSHSQTPVVLNYILLAWWIQHSHSEGEGAVVRPLPPHLSQRFAEAQRAGLLAGDSSPLALRMMAAGLLSRENTPPPDPADFLRSVVDAIGLATPSDPVRELDLYEKRYILHRLGLSPEPVSIDYGEMIRFAQGQILTDGGRRVDDLLVRIESLTRYGTTPRPTAARDEWLEDLLWGIAQHAFRKYDWSRGCRALRALGYLDLCSKRSFEHAMAFFALHQRVNGSFGYFGPEARALNAAEDSLALDLGAALPVTIECLWTIAELTGNRRWRLYPSLQRIPAAGVSGAGLTPLS